MIRVARGTIRVDGVDYSPGKTISGLSEEEETRLISKGVAEAEEYKVTMPPEPPKPPKQNTQLIISNMNAKDAIAFAESIDDIMELNKLGMEETEGKNRATVVKVISERIKKLEASGGVEPDNGGSGDGNKKNKNADSGNSDEKLNLQLNPDDVIVS